MCVCCVSSVLLHFPPVSGWVPKQAFFGDKHYLCCCCFFLILLFKMQISNTCCSLTRTAHSWDIDTNNFRFSVDSMKQNFRFDYFFQFSHKKGSFFSRFIYSIYSYRLQPEWVHLAVDVKRSDEAHKCWRRVTAVCSLKCQHWLWGKLLKSTSIIMTWGNTLMNKISNCALSV